MQSEVTATPYNYGDRIDPEDPTRSANLCPETGCGQKATMQTPNGVGNWFECPNGHQWGTWRGEIIQAPEGD